MLPGTQGTAEPPANPVRKAVHTVMLHRYTDHAMVFIILANTFVMFLSFYGMNATWAAAINTTNLIVTVIFTVEMLLK